MGPQATASFDLEVLYSEMWTWARPFDPLVAHRRIEAVDIRSRLFIVGEAPAAGQVLRSGVN